MNEDFACITAVCENSSNFKSNTRDTRSHHLTVRIQDFHSWYTSSILVESTTRDYNKSYYWCQSKGCKLF